MLLPLHSGYDLLLRAWEILHPSSTLCVEDPALDFPIDGCLPYLFPLRSVRDECSTKYGSLSYEYERFVEQWVGPARAAHQ